MGVAVLRTAMSVQTIARSADQLIITFTDMTQDGGDFTIWFDDQLADGAVQGGTLDSLPRGRPIIPPGI
jgi:hypothetical protein